MIGDSPAPGKVGNSWLLSAFFRKNNDGKSFGFKANLDKVAEQIAKILSITKFRKYDRGVEFFMVSAKAEKNVCRNASEIRYPNASRT